MEVEVADPQTATNGMKIASTLSTTKSQVLVPNAVELETSVVPPELAEDDDLLAEEIEIFRNSLYTFDLDLDNKVAAQQFYASASKLAALYCEQPNDRVAVELQALRRPGLVRLVSSATKSWMKWSSRKIGGVVTAGIVQSVSREDGQTVVRIETYDARNSNVLVAIDERDGSVVEEGKEVLILGVILVGPEGVGPQDIEIRGFTLPANLLPDA